MSDWSALHSLTSDEALASFKQDCINTLKLNEQTLTLFWEAIGSYPPDVAFAGLTTSPSVENAKRALENVREYFEEEIQFETLESLLEESNEARLAPTPSGPPLTTLLRTLIDAMAAASKLGHGEELGCGEVEGIRELTNHIFKTRTFLKLIKDSHKAFKNYKRSTPNVYWAFMAPYAFTYAMYLDRGAKDLAELSFLKQNNMFPKNMAEFEKIQNDHFGGCLSEVSLKIKQYYHELFYALEGESTFEDLTTLPDPDRIGLSQEIIDPTTIILMNIVQVNCAKKIRERIAEGDTLHRMPAINWLRSSDTTVSTISEDSSTNGFEMILGMFRQVSLQQTTIMPSIVKDEGQRSAMADRFESSSDWGSRSNSLDSTGWSEFLQTVSPKTVGHAASPFFYSPPPKTNGHDEGKEAEAKSSSSTSVETNNHIDFNNKERASAFSSSSRR